MLYLVFGTQQYFRLHLRGEFDEIIAVSANSNDKVAIGFGVFLRRQKRFFVHDVDLQFKAAAL